MAGFGVDRGSGSSPGGVADLAASTGSSLVGFVQSGIGAIARTVQAKARDVVSVLDFIPVAEHAAIQDGTSTTDVTAYFQAAHDALPATGGAIYVPRGVYTFNQTAEASLFSITTSNVHLRGEGWASQLKRTVTGVGTTGPAVVRVKATSAAVSNICLSDFRITGPTASTGAAIVAGATVSGILIGLSTDTADITDVLITNVLIEKMEGVAFQVTTAAATAVRRIQFANCWARNGRGNGFNPISGNVYDLTVQNCHATDLDAFGMEMGNAGGMTLIGNTIMRCGQAGIGIEYNNTISPTRRVLIANNYISDIGTVGYPNGHGISLGQSQNPINTMIVGNTIQRIEGHGIIVNGSPTDIHIVNNTIQDVGGDATNTRGITIGTAPVRAVIKGNTIVTAGAGYAMTYGVFVGGNGASGNVISNNSVVGATAIDVFAHSPNKVSKERQPIIVMTSVGNVGTGEDDLMSATIPANAVWEDNFTSPDTPGLHIVAWGETAANGNNKTVKLYVGGVLLLTTTAIAANSVDWMLEAYVIVTGATQARVVGRGEFNGAVVTTNASSDLSPLSGWNSATVIKCTGEATSDNDIVQRGLVVRYIDQPSNA